MLIVFHPLGQVNHENKEANIATGLLCCICFGFGLFSIHFGWVSHAKKMANIALGLLLCCICLGLGLLCVHLGKVSHAKQTLH